MSEWYTLPKGIEVVLKVFSASSLKQFINAKNGQTVDARAFNLETLAPVNAGEERRAGNKWFVYKPVSAVHVDGMIRKYGWTRVANMVTDKTGVGAGIEFVEEIKRMVESGAKHITIVSLANTLGRSLCRGNKLLYRVGDFTAKDMDFDDHDESWNAQLEKMGSPWRINSGGLTVVNVLKRPNK
jgi:hypothetical protein